MKEIVTTNYFWGQDVEMSQFYRVPKALYTGEYFRGISFEAKAIYGMMIDRVRLSIKNGWLDEKNRVYIIYTIEEMRRDLGCATEKIRHVRKYQKAGNERCLKSHRSVPAF